MAAKILRKRTNFSQITAAYPHLKEDAELESVAEDLDEAQDLQRLAESDGGKALITAKAEKAYGLILDIIRQAKEDNHLILVSTIARLEAHLDVISELKGAKETADGLQEVVDQMVLNKK